MGEGRRQTGGGEGARAATPAGGDDLLARWMAHHEGGEAPEADVAQPEAEPDPALDPGPDPGPDDVVGPPAPAAVHSRRPAQPPVAPADVTFPPRRGTRRVLGFALVLMLAATALAAVNLREESDVEALTLLGTMVALTLVTWAVRAGSARTTLELRGGQLHVHTGGRRTTFDLTSSYTPVEVIGRPGRRGWKVVLGRGSSRRPFVVDASLVDPHRFTEELRRYRPE